MPQKLYNLDSINSSVRKTIKTFINFHDSHDFDKVFFWLSQRPPLRVSHNIDSILVAIRMWSVVVLPAQNKHALWYLVNDSGWKEEKKRERGKADAINENEQRVSIRRILLVIGVWQRVLSSDSHTIRCVANYGNTLNARVFDRWSMDNCPVPILINFRQHSCRLPIVWYHRLLSARNAIMSAKAIQNSS